MKRRTRFVLIASIVVVALVGSGIGLRAWSVANQREKTAEAFAMLRSVDRRIDLPRYIPNMKRTEDGVEVRLEGPGPVIAYSFHVSETPDWEARLDEAMQQAGYSGDEPWELQVHGGEVLVGSTPPEAGHDVASVLISAVRPPFG